MSPLFLLLHPAFYCWAWCHMAWDMPLLSWGLLCWLCPLPASCAPPAPWPVGWGEKQKRHWLCVSTAQQWLKYPWIINTVFSTYPKHSPILATMKKTNSIPAETCTQTQLGFSAWLCHRVTMETWEDPGSLPFPALTCSSQLFVKHFDVLSFWHYTSDSE